MKLLAIFAGVLVAIGANAASASILAVTSYDMNNGCGNSCGGTYNYWDGNYNGSGSPTVSNSFLSGGTGALTDGIIATQPWYDVSNGNRSHPPAVQAAAFAGIMGRVRLARAAAMREQA